MQRFVLLCVLPVLALSVSAFVSLMDGSETLYMRDVLSTHYPVKSAHVHLMKTGPFPPLVDPFRSGGQPFLGNPNALPIYPTNLLYRVAPTLWALNAHFWLHLLVAPWAMFLMARSFGLSRSSAWVAGTTYAGGGYFLSLTNLYNLITGAVWTPVLVAACLRRAASREAGPSFPVASSFALLLLSGDPMSAALGTAAALSATFLCRRPGPATLGSVASSLGLGALLAAPVWMEMLRILPLSYRGFHTASAESGLAQSWHPAAIVEWFVPLALGAPDIGFWGKHFYGGHLPLLLTLFPGPLAIAAALGAGGGRFRRVDGRTWAWLWIAGGIFLAAGAHNPVVRFFYDVPGVSALRYPMKCWLVVALGAALLTGFGWERFLRGKRNLTRNLGFLTLSYLALWLLLLRTPTPLRTFLASLSPVLRPDDRFRAELLAWLTSTFLVLVICGTLWWVSRWALRVPGGVWCLLLPTLHFAGQLVVLQPVIDGVDARPFLTLPSPLAEMSTGSRLLHGGGSARLFGTDGTTIPDTLSDLARRDFRTAAPYAGVALGFPYEMNRSPEGLDSFSSVALAKTYPRLDDGTRVRVAAALGVDRLIMNRPLGPSAADTVGAVRTYGSGLDESWVYEVQRSLPEIALIKRTIVAASPFEAVETLGMRSFDPRRSAVVTPGGPALGEPTDEDLVTDDQVHVVQQSTERTVVDVSTGTAGLLVTRRAWLPIYRASVDGEPTPLQVVNIYKTGVLVPAGRHRVEIATDRRPTYAAGALAFVALLVLFIAETRSRP